MASQMQPDLLGTSYPTGRERGDEVLLKVYEATGGQPKTVIHTSGFAQELGMDLEHFFTTVLQCVDAGYLSYAGAGPQVSITELGVFRVLALLEGLSG